MSRREGKEGEGKEEEGKGGGEDFVHKNDHDTGNNIPQYCENIGPHL